MGKNNKRCLSKFITATMVMISLTATDNTYAKDVSSYNKSHPNAIASSANLYKYNEQGIYNKIYNSIINLKDEVDISKYVENANTDADKASKVFYKVLNDHSEIFYVSKKISYNYGIDGQGNPILKIKITYNGSKEDIKNKIIALDKEVNRIIHKYTSSNMSDLEKELAIHDYLVLNTKYDQENYEKNTVQDISHTSYGALINHTAVCDGYSNAFKLLLSKVGIKSIIVSSEQMHHAWNIVTLENNNYQVDVTWDDPVPDREGKVRYKYFNLDDDSIKKDLNPHIWNENEYPKCTDNRYSYLSNMSNVIKSNNSLYYKEDTKEGLFKVDINGTNKEIIIKDNVESFVINGNYIYYTNYSKNGYIYKVNLDGTNDTVFKSVSAKNLTLKDNKLEYEDYNTNKKDNIALNDIVTSKKALIKSITSSKKTYIEGEHATITVKFENPIKNNINISLSGAINIKNAVMQKVNGGNQFTYTFVIPRKSNGDVKIDISNIIGENGVSYENYSKDLIFRVEKIADGWKQENSYKAYYKDGNKLTGLQSIEGRFYLFNINGEMQTSWQEVNNKKYYFDIITGQASIGKQTIENKNYQFDNFGVLTKEVAKETVKPKDEHKEVKPSSNKEENKEKEQISEKESQKETIKPKDEHKEVKPSSNKEENKEKEQVLEKESQKETVKPKDEHKEVKPSSNKEENKEKEQVLEKESQKETVKPKDEHKEVKPSSNKEENKEKEQISEKESQKETVKPKDERKEVKPSSNKEKEYVAIKLITEKKKKYKKVVVSNKTISEGNENKDTTEIVDNKNNKIEENNTTIKTQNVNEEKDLTNKDNINNKKEDSNKKNVVQNFFEKIVTAIKEIFEKIMSIFK